MIEIKNQFARNILFWVLSLPFLYVIIAPAMLDADSLKVPQSELAVAELVGRKHTEITESANQTFTRLFVNTGAVEAINKLFVSKSRSGVDPDGVNNISRLGNSYVEKFWNIIYRAIWRFTALWPILSVLLVCLVIPALIDGIAIRSRKLDQFKPHNPVFFWASAHSAISTAGFFLLLPFLPFPITIWVLYGSVIAVAFFTWVTATNLQTGN